MSRRVVFKMSEEMQCTPPELLEIANTSVATLIPTKSRKIYENAYDKFINWAKENNAHIYSENVMIAYFTRLSRTLKSSTLWAQYSMVKSKLNIEHNVNIEKYSKLITFLKRQGENYKPKKSKVLSKKEFDEFLNKAPDDKYLATKVALIFGVTGACRCDELIQVKVNDVKDLGNIILVNIPNTKTKKHRSFTIIGEFYLNLYRKYATLRPKDITFDRFFIKYQNGHCHRVVMGIHKISKVPKDVASFLRLPNPHEYTGHCLRRTSATILVDNGGDITTLKRHGGWKSTSVAEGYIEDSVNNKKQIAMKILNPLEYNEPSTSSETVNIDPENNLIEDFSVNNGTIVNTETENLITSNVFNDRTVNFEKKTASSALNINNCTIQNCTFNIHVNK